MSVPASVAVNPQSSTEAGSHAGGGFGDQNWNFGGNPNLAMLAGSKAWPWAFAAIGVAVILFAFRKK